MPIMPIVHMSWPSHIQSYCSTSQLRSFRGCAMWLGDSEQLFPVFQSCDPGFFRVFSRLTKNLYITVHFWGNVMPTSVEVTRTFWLELPVVLDLTSCSPKSIIGLRSTTEKLGVNISELDGKTCFFRRLRFLWSAKPLLLPFQTFAPTRRLEFGHSQGSTIHPQVARLPIAWQLDKNYLL